MHPGPPSKCVREARAVSMTLQMVNDDQQRCEKRVMQSEKCTYCLVTDRCLFEKQLYELMPWQFCTLSEVKSPAPGEVQVNNKRKPWRKHWKRAIRRWKQESDQGRQKLPRLCVWQKACFAYNRFKCSPFHIKYVVADIIQGIFKHKNEGQTYSLFSICINLRCYFRYFPQNVSRFIVGEATISQLKSLSQIAKNGAYWFELHNLFF